MKRAFSAKDRAAALQELAGRRLDLLIIGGGITGAAIAWDASKRGMVTGLIEMDDFAFGASSRTSKLIRSGAHHVKQLQFRLARQAGQERALLSRLAPHLVVPTEMLLPIYKRGVFGKYATSLGLYVYDRLAGVDKGERRVMYDREETLQLEPLLKQEGLIGSCLYYEYRTDDARLVLEVLKTAHRHGALIANYVQADEFLYRNSKIAGVRVMDRLSGEEIELYAKKVINAAGPWTDLVRAKDHAVKGKQLPLSKGVHLVVDHARLPVQQSAYLHASDGRILYVIPREGKVYMGTTATAYEGNLERPRTSEADIDYVLKAVNTTMPNASLTHDDVEAMWSGLRPLIQETGKLRTKAKTADAVSVSSSGLITVTSGKLTGFRRMAGKVTDTVAQVLGHEEGVAFGPCTTDREALSGGSSGRYDTYAEYRQELMKLLLSKGIQPETAEYLLTLYGSNAAAICMRMDAMEKPKQPDHVAEGDLEVRSGEVEETAVLAPEATQPSTDAADAEDPSVGKPDETEPTEPATCEDISTAKEYIAASKEASAGEQDEALPQASPRTPLETVFGPNPSPEERILAAEIAYCIEEEMAVSAADFLVRRTGLLYFNRPQAERIAADVLELMALHLNWSESELDRQRVLLAKEWENVTVPTDR